MHPETYLRLACERLLGSNAGVGAGFEGAAATAQALVAAGSLDEATANAVFDEYAVAIALRGGLEPEEALWRRRTQLKVDLPASRTVLGPLPVGPESAGLVLHRLFLAENTTEFELSSTSTRRPGKSTNRRWQRGPLRPLWARPEPFLPPVTVADDRGAAATASASGCFDLDPGWKAPFVADHPLRPTTAWLDIDGAACQLPPPGPPPEQWTEAVPRASRTLEGTALPRPVGAPGDSGFPRPGRGPWGKWRPAVRALVATGSLPAADPVLAEVERVAKAVSGRRAVGGLPEPWASLFRRVGKHDGPVGFVAIGVAVNSSDGWSVRFDSLTSEEQEFRVAVVVSPRAVLPSTHASGAGLEQLCTRPVAIEWRAEDDLGNSYLATGDRWGNGEGVAAGHLSFLAPIDPEARELDLIATGLHERAVVSISLEGLGGSP